MKCPCFYAEQDPEVDPVDNDDIAVAEICECGHAMDEHDADGECQVELAE